MQFPIVYTLKKNATWVDTVLKKIRYINTSSCPCYFINNL